eukprot:2579390-Amphidinium_carterae.1
MNRTMQFLQCAQSTSRSVLGPWALGQSCQDADMERSQHEERVRILKMLFMQADSVLQISASTTLLITYRNEVVWP